MAFSPSSKHSACFVHSALIYTESRHPLPSPYLSLKANEQATAEEAAVHLTMWKFNNFPDLFHIIEITWADQVLSSYETFSQQDNFESSRRNFPPDSSIQILSSSGTTMDRTVEYSSLVRCVIRESQYGSRHLKLEITHSQFYLTTKVSHLPSLLLGFPLYRSICYGIFARYTMKFYLLHFYCLFYLAFSLNH